MTNARGVLAIFAHPDDESLVAGGTLAACAAAGLETGIVSLTRGEAGPIGDRSISRERLGYVREQELQAARQGSTGTRTTSPCTASYGARSSWRDSIRLPSATGGPGRPAGCQSLPPR